MSARVAVVTGAGAGVGPACCRELARRGAAVVAQAGPGDRAAAGVVAEIARGGGAAWLGEADGADPAAMEALFERVGGRHGGVDWLVNNAGLAGGRPLEETAEQEWDEVVRAGLKAVYASARAALPWMMAAGGAIVSVSSIAATVGGRGFVAQAAAAGGVEAFTRALAIELAPKRIRVNAVAPGHVEDGAGPRLRPAAPAAELVPMRRPARPEEVAAAVAYLLSDDASYVTGEVLRVSGGLS